MLNDPASLTAQQQAELHYGSVRHGVTIVIKDPVELITHKKTIKVHRGINRYYWNREFDAQEYTAEEAQKVEAIFQDILANNAALGVMYKRSNTAKNPYDKRKVVESLKGGFLSYPIPDRFGIVKAEEGYYEIHLSTDNKSEVGSVELRRDPILERAIEYVKTRN